MPRPSPGGDWSVFRWTRPVSRPMRWPKKPTFPSGRGAYLTAMGKTLMTASTRRY